MRRGDYKKVTGSTVFALKFCAIRWVENKDVCSRALSILPYIQKFVTAVEHQEDSKMKASHPDFRRTFKATRGSMYYAPISQAAKDKLMGAKLAFFISIAEILEPFLKSYQSSSPMLPFLYDDLLSKTKRLMKKSYRIRVRDR